MLTLLVLKGPQKQGRTGHGHGIEATTCSGAGGRAYRRRRHNIWGVGAGPHKILGVGGHPERAAVIPPRPHFYPSRKKNISPNPHISPIRKHPQTRNTPPSGTKSLNVPVYEKHPKTLQTGCMKNETTFELLPCPFCSGKPESINNGGRYSLHCTDCGVWMGDDSPEEVVRGWNTRKGEQLVEQNPATLARVRVAYHSTHIAEECLDEVARLSEFIREIIRPESDGEYAGEVDTQK